MTLFRCQTVRECIAWMDSRIPGYWDFATKKPMSPEQIQSIVAELKKSWFLFDQMIRKAYHLYRQNPQQENNASYITLLNQSFSPVVINPQEDKLIDRRIL